MSESILVLILIVLSGIATQIARAVNGALPAMVVSLEPAEFGDLMSNVRQPLIITWQRGLFTRKVVYLWSYQGHRFVTESSSPLTLPADAKMVQGRGV